jgi:coproporphyrinogen III oxidase-like Fe-S oxidoreductase
VAEFEARFALDFEGHFGKPLADLAQDGFLLLSDGRCVLTRKGIRLLDSIVARLI